MKNMFALALLMCLLAVAVQSADEDKYPTYYDNINVDDILNNKRILKNYVECLLAKGVCTPEGSLLKDKLPDALETRCIKCSEAQKTIVKKFLKYLQKNREDYFALLVDKYDPDRKYTKIYGEAFQNI